MWGPNTIQSIDVSTSLTSSPQHLNSKGNNTKGRRRKDKYIQTKNKKEFKEIEMKNEI